MNGWNPPETAPKDRVFIITTAGPQQDLCFYDKKDKVFRDYFHRQKIPNAWPHMVAWKELGEPAEVCNSEAESRQANGWK
jgi:hypothetical protein